VALARAEHRAPALASAFRAARITGHQAAALLRVAHAGRVRIRGRAPDGLTYLFLATGECFASGDLRLTRSA
jgi:hypothetical protein